MRYEPSAVDKAAFPGHYAHEERYLGYREAELAKPYAHFFRPITRPIQAHVTEALVSGMAPPELGYNLDWAAKHLSRPGHESLETGWTRLENGIIMVNVLTHMPNVTAAMWDWWFGWHGRETARYKLWHPEAHIFSTVGEDRSADRSLSDRQRYVGNVSYADEYVGGLMQRLAIRFFPPEKLGFVDTPETTYICARVTLSTLPIAIGWLVHQVRPTEDGSEMRSRFFLNAPEVLALPARSLPTSSLARTLATPIGRTAASAVVRPMVARLLPPTTGTDMIFHCAGEMNHLAGFLPELYAEFRDSP